uniref:ribonuclease Z n=1 Tax=Plectus sambesii TaxID=2011161 RepID=A0A914W7Y5_9BILA
MVPLYRKVLFLTKDVIPLAIVFNQSSRRTIAFCSLADPLGKYRSCDNRQPSTSSSSPLPFSPKSLKKCRDFNSQTSSVLRDLNGKSSGVQAKYSDKWSGSDNENLPSTTAVLEILSNGTDAVRPCVVLRTTSKVYFFDCPEGILKLLHGQILNDSRRVRPSDIFVTRSGFDHMGGVATFFLSSDFRREKMRLHGPPNIVRFLENFRGFMDEDGDERGHIKVEERTLESGKFEDETLIVHYLPLTKREKSSKDSLDRAKRRANREKVGNLVDLAYLVEFKKPRLFIDLNKCLALKVPKGLLNKLMLGLAVTLPNGRVVKPDDVCVSSNAGEELEPTFLVVNCPSPEHIGALSDSTALQRYKISNSSTGQSLFLKYVVHYTDEKVLRSREYEEWMMSFGTQTIHLIVNGSGPPLPHSEVSYHMQSQLNHLHADVFPILHCHGFEGTLPNVAPEAPPDRPKVIIAEPFMRFSLRSSVLLEEAPSKSIFKRDLAVQKLKKSPDFDRLYASFRKEADSLQVKETFPRLTVLGSSSSVATRYRNTSGYLLELNSDSCLIVDCGEGTYSQMLALFGLRRTNELLRNLQFLFISHGHYDHFSGIFSMILQHRKAFLATGEKPKPLRVLGPSCILPALNFFDHSIEPLTDFYTMTLTSNLRAANRRAADLWNRQGIVDIGSCIPEFDSMPIKRLLVVKVDHVRQAKGLILELADGKKIVFSGDSKPCGTLVKAGNGADLLVHEATLSDDLETYTNERFHSTMGQAVIVGEEMNAKRILLTHFSSRFGKCPLLPDYLDKKGNVGIAMDYMVVRWSELALLPKLIPLFRSIYSEDMNSYEMETAVKMQKAAKRSEKAKSSGKADIFGGT